MNPKNIKEEYPVSVISLQQYQIIKEMNWYLHSIQKYYLMCSKKEQSEKH